MAQEAGRFPCTLCGACCRHIGKIAELADFDNGNGICKHLDETTNTCTIYANRPKICRVDAMFETFANSYSRQEFYALNLKACQILRQKNKN